MSTDKILSLDDVIQQWELNAIATAYTLPSRHDPTDDAVLAVGQMAKEFEMAVDRTISTSRCDQLHERLLAMLVMLTDTDVLVQARRAALVSLRPAWRQ